MKTRNGFVSNSSSCSFYFQYDNELSLDDVKRSFPLKEGTPDYVKVLLWETALNFILRSKDNKTDEFGFNSIGVIDDNFIKWLDNILEYSYSDDSYKKKIKDTFTLGKKYFWFEFWDYDIDDEESEQNDTDKAILYLRDSSEEVSKSGKMFGFSVG